MTVNHAFLERGAGKAEVPERRGGEKGLEAAGPVPLGLQREMLLRMALRFCSLDAVWTHRHLQPPRAITPRRGKRKKKKKKKEKKEE